LMIIQSYIAGDFIAGKSTAHSFPLVSPITLQSTASIEEADADVVKRAVDAAEIAFREYARSAVAIRVKWLNQAATRLEAESAPLIEAIIQDIGKPRRAATFEVGRAVQFVRACAIQLQTMTGETLPLDATDAGAGHFGFTRRVPYGVVAAITPFNAPANLLIQKVAPALAAGNALVVKPHPAGTRTALLMAEVFIASGLPAGLFNVVVGDRDPASVLSADPRVRAVTFTGGTAAGEAIARVAGAKKYIAELGSNAANVVMADADIADAAKRIALAGFDASGQQCVSAQRVIVHEDVYDDFLALFVQAAAALKVGPPDLPDTDVGTMISLAAAERVMQMAHSAVAAGAHFALAPRIQGSTVSPGILVDAGLRSGIWTDEVFGPLVVVQRFATTDEALRLANDSPFGLQGAVFTRDIGAAFRFADEFEVGAMWINEASRFRLDTYPFGGVKMSGFGREGVKYAIEEMSQIKFIGLRPF
jgi:acyl-CoA reductase-like NAD-dependent aldehyde dehydrogenase